MADLSIRPGGGQRPTERWNRGFIAYEVHKRSSKEEALAFSAWKGPRLSPIRSAQVLVAATPPDQAFQDLMRSIWHEVPTAVAGAAPARPGMIGQARAGFSPPPQPSPPQPSPPQPSAAMSGPPQPSAPQLSPPAMSPQIGLAGQPVAIPPDPKHPFKIPKDASPAARAHLEGYARDWREMEDLPRVSGYAFRGDFREPERIKSRQGFRPSAERTELNFVKDALYPEFSDYLARQGKGAVPLNDFLDFFYNAPPDAADKFGYRAWKILMDQEKYHLGRMIASQTLKGYVSTTKAVTVAKGFAVAKEGVTEGWVYCLRLKGGIEIPAKDSGHPWAQVFGEEEIAHPGGILWEDVVACRKVNKETRLFEGPVYMRPEVWEEDKRAAKEIYKLLSGKDQSQPDARKEDGEEKDPAEMKDEPEKKDQPEMKELAKKS